MCGSSSCLRFFGKGVMTLAGNFVKDVEAADSVLRTLPGGIDIFYIPYLFNNLFFMFMKYIIDLE